MWSFDFFLNVVVISFWILVWEIRILVGRYCIRNFDDFERDCIYVVMGREWFKNVGYVSLLFVCYFVCIFGVFYLIEM